MQRPPQLQTPFFRIPQGTRYEAPQAMQKRTQTTPTNLFKTQQANQLTSRQQQEATRERECLTYAPALAKLKLEADKIRKWKTATQFELKKKESQLVEVREQLKVQQETVTNMRVREEALKTRLQDQMSSHTEIQHKILVTRGLCSTLKEKVEQCEDALKQGQADQKDNMDLDNLRMEQYRALADKFKELEQQQAEVQRSLEEALMTEQERGRGLDKELTDERAQSAQLCTENTLLQEQLSAIRREELCVRGHLEEAQKRLQEEEGVREEAEKQCQQLQQQLNGSEEHSQTLQTTITSLHEEISSLKSGHNATVSSLQQELSQTVQMCSDLRTQAQQYSLTVDTQQAQLASAAREKENMEVALASLREELCAMEYSRRDDVTELQGQLREKEADHVKEVAALQTSLTAVQASHTALQQQLLEAETGCVAKEKAMAELSHSLEEKEAVRVELQSQVTGLQDHVQELEREREERKGEREREKKEAETTVLSLTTELETLRKQFDDQQRTGGERVSKLESENGELTKELSEMRQKCEEAIQRREEQQRSSEAILAEVRSQTAREVEQCRQEADRARETQLREKEGFDTQVTELCGMLEKYRSENNKIVQQKDLQIHSLQSSLADANKAKESLEEMVRGAQEEGLGLQEEVGRLQQVMREREEEAKEREARVTEKEREMAELLKAIDTLRSKQQQSDVCTPQSTSHTSSHPPPLPSSPTHSPHTPHMATVSSIAPLTAPTQSSLHSLRHQRSSRTGSEYHTRTTPMSTTPSVTYATPSRPASLRPAVKKVRREETDTESEDILFRKPHPLSARSRLQHPKEPDMLSGRREGAGHLEHPRAGGGYSCYSSPSVSAAGSVSDHEVTSTGISKRVKSTPGRGRSGRGRKSGGGGERKVTGGGRERKVTGGERKQAGTAWFDLDAVFGFGPED